MVLKTDASMKGWGANHPKEGTSTGSRWSAKEATHHINWLELKAAFLALQCFQSNLNNIRILLKMESQVMDTYVNKKGGARLSALCNLALKLWDWCIKRSITVKARHLPGCLNTTADYESRQQTDFYIHISTCVQVMGPLKCEQLVVSDSNSDVLRALGSQPFLYFNIHAYSFLRHMETIYASAKQLDYLSFHGI